VTGILYTDFPILRFECNAPPFYKRKDNHRTFSLLPAHLVPYERFDIPFIIAIAKARLSGESIKAICDRSADLLKKEPLLLGVEKICSIVNMVEQAFNRLPLIPDFVAAFNALLKPTLSNSILNFIEWAECFHTAIFPDLTGPVSLAFDYYRKGLPLVMFLFGTPSQQR